jgi:hypothetical protein
VSYRVSWSIFPIGTYRPIGRISSQQQRRGRAWRLTPYRPPPEHHQDWATRALAEQLRDELRLHWGADRVVITITAVELKSRLAPMPQLALPVIGAERRARGPATNNPTEEQMNVRDFLGSRYLAAADIGNERQTAIVSAVTTELIGRDREEKLVLHLQDTKPIVLNVTNIRNLSQLGADTDDWIGQHITIWAEATTYGGRPVQRLRCGPATAEAQPRRQRNVVGLRGSNPNPVKDELDDDIPF